MDPNQHTQPDSSSPPPQQPDYPGTTGVPVIPQSPVNGVPTVQGQVYSGSGGTTPSPAPNSSRKKKRLIIGGAVTAIVVLLSAGYVFGFYLPNTPDRVWSTGLARTGKTVDQLVLAATEEEKLAKTTNSEFTGSVEANLAGQTYKGSFNSRYDVSRSDSSLAYNNGSQKDFNLKLLTDLADSQDYPDIYFQVTGLNSLGAEQFFPGLGDYEDKWIAVSSSYLKSALPVEEETAGQNAKFTQQDAAELARIISATTREYVFSTDADKAVMKQKEFVGTEKFENDITANHYKVGINKTNAKKYCNALVGSFMSADAYKRLPGVNAGTIDQDKKDVVQECNESIDKDIDDNDEFDMWIDKKYKLVHKVRFSDKEDKGSYLEVGQNYTEGNVIPLFVTMHSDKEKYDGKLTLEVDTEKSITTGSLNFEYKDEQTYSAKASFEFKPSEKDVIIERPVDAIPIEQLMQSLNIEPSELENINTASRGL